ncbi:MAG TPA: VOC family protein [Candidatus Saccharimonadales bacterium]
MLENSKFLATIAVNNIEKAKEFYEGKLELQRVAENPRGVTYETGGGNLFIYQSPSAGTSQASVATWELAEIDSLVAAMEAKGIVFEHYDMPDTSWEGSIATMGDVQVAWFKDPDGNLLSVGTPQP